MAYLTANGLFPSLRTLPKGQRRNMGKQQQLYPRRTIGLLASLVAAVAFVALIPHKGRGKDLQAKA